jgi:hypothetical protein
VYKRELKEYKHILLIISINNIMQQYIIHLNGGYNPFVHLGRGALGYRPLRKMIGRGGEGEQGGGGGGPVNNEDKKYLEFGDNPIFDMIRQLQQQSNQQVSLPTTTPTTTTTTLTPATTTPTNIIQQDDSGESKTENLEEMNFEEKIDSLFDKIAKKAQSKIDMKKIAKEYNTLVSALNDAITIIENKPLTTVSYKRNLLSNAYIKSIESISTFITKNKVGSIEKNAVALINDWLSILNNPEFYSDGRTYKLEEGKVVKYDKPKQEGPLDFPLNIKTQDEAIAIINEYWTKNEKVKLKTDDRYDDDINTMITQINESIKNKILDKPLNENIDKQNVNIVKTFPNETISKKYAETIVVNNKYKYFEINNTTKEIDNTKQKKKHIDDDTYDLFDYDFNMPGKAQEFSICGYKSTIATKIYGIENPNIQITDFIVDNILPGSIGSQFCADCIDIDNRMIIEVKKYEDISYLKIYNLQIELKKNYINDLKHKFLEFVKGYIDTQESNTIKRKSYLENMRSIQEVLTDKNKFNKDFYNNRRYCGVGITMNKFNPIDIPTDYVYDNNFNTEEMMLHVKKSQGQKFIPTFVNREITKITRKPTDDKAQDAKFNKDFNDKIKGTVKPYKFNITCLFNGGQLIGVYYYSNDELVENDFILGTYRCAYKHDGRGNKGFNAVLIPIENFIIEAKVSNVIKTKDLKKPKTTNEI